MATNAHIESKKNENGVNVLKRFTRKVQESGVLRHLRNRRWLTRDLSPYTQKVQKLKAINRKAEVEQMIKMGKPPVQKRGRR